MTSVLPEFPARAATAPDSPQHLGSAPSDDARTARNAEGAEGAERAERAEGALRSRYDFVRAATERLAAPLQTEDYVVSSMPDVSPTKWHLAHTSWFFETFVLTPWLPSYRALDPRYAFLFNSYYVQAGERHCRAQRGLVTRPTVQDVYAYRAHVDGHMRELIARIGDDASHPAYSLIELGGHHEQQHQELLVTDIKHVFWTNPMRPAYREDTRRAAPYSPQGWVTIEPGVREIGHHDDGFHFDNESPRHRQYLQHARVADRLVTNAEYAAFIADGGYARTELWLSAGWATVQAHGWTAPLYWERQGEQWLEFTLAGTAPIDPHAPVTHVSYFEADAYARWAGVRLPTEFEWEVLAREHPVAGRFAEAERFHPAADAHAAGDAKAGGTVQQLYGDAWQWTQSAYVAYPGYRPVGGALGEYNGKWMSDQWVLRGASCATPESHARVSYRNFFPSDARWQFTGIRLAEDEA